MPAILFQFFHVYQVCTEFAFATESQDIGASLGWRKWHVCFTVRTYVQILSLLWEPLCVVDFNSELYPWIIIRASSEEQRNILVRFEFIVYHLLFRNRSGLTFPGSKDL